ncbi:nucleoside triphosphate pyrophosphohydrolase family protein [Patescibacteria group bacterium]|nr:nucleoside triphosphate pyrophosphohydrolase family protein [Patescibacteria group bacterium]
MEFTEYQKKAEETAIYPNRGNNITYPALGLGGETGEVLEEIKRVLRDDNSKVSEERKKNIEKEMGDVLWYLATLSTELGLDLNKIAELNIEKLSSRKERDQLHGSGADR